jgi:hypothetical protein
VAYGAGVTVDMKKSAEYTQNSLKAVKWPIYAVNSAKVATDGTAITSTTSYAVYAASKAEVTVTGGTVASNAQTFYADAATITIDGPTSISNSNYTPIYAANKATVNLRKGDLTNPSTGATIASINTGSTFNMTGGSLNYTGTSNRALFLSSATANISAGTISSTHLGVVMTGSTLDISGGTITTSSAEKRAISAENQSTVTISEKSTATPTKISSTNTACSAQTVAVMLNSTLNMTGGSITGVGNSETVGVLNGGVATITGGSITSNKRNALFVYETNKSYKSTAATIGGNAYLLSENYNCVAIMPIGTDNTDNYSGDRNTSRPAVKLTVKDNAQIVTTGKLSADTYSAVLGNGMCHNTEINIEGGTLTSTGVGLYHPQIGTLNISGGTIEGGCTAVEVRAGTLNLTGGTLTSTASEFSVKKNGSGFTTTGAALSIAQHTYGDAVTAEGVASGNPTVKATISKTETSEPTLEGIYAFYESNPNETQDVKEKVTLSITGGKFSGQVGSTDFTGFISGGSFKGYGDTFPSALIASGKALSSSATDDYYTIE